MSIRNTLLNLRFALFGVLVAVALSGCGDGLPKASERPIPSMLPEAERAEHRRLPVSGADNFRDVGGYPTTDGKRVRWGLLYRSNDLADLSRQDKMYLQRLGIKQVSDFRSAAEREDDPSNLPAGIEVKEFAVESLSGEVFEKLRDAEFLRKSDPVELMKNINREFVSEFTPVFAAWLRDLADGDATPQIVHCTAGKDRTGFAVAMLLRILGVPRQIAMEDYMLSAKYQREETDRILAMVAKLSAEDLDVDEKVRPLLSVRKSYLRAAYAQMRKRYGSVDNYIRRGLGVDKDLRKALRQRFLETL